MRKLFSNVTINWILIFLIVNALYIGLQSCENKSDGRLNVMKTAEKNVQYRLRAIDLIKKQYPNAKIYKGNQNLLI